MYRPKVTKVFNWSFLLIVAISATITATTTTPSPTNMTTPAGNATTLTPSNTTTPASNATTPTPTNTTTPASNATTPTPTNATTPASNATTPTPTNATTPASNATTPASNATTPSSNTTTVAPTSAPVARWAINDNNGTLCMLMDFNGTLTFNQQSGKVVTYIPAKNDVKMSTCESKTAKFVLEFSSNGGVWQLILNFTMKGSSYELHKMAINVYTSGGVLIGSAYSAKTFFTVPVGRYYSCDWFNQSISPFNVNLTNPVFQPFVQQTASHHDLGDVYRCGSDAGGGGPNISLVVGIILGIIVVVAAVAAVYFLVKRSKTSASPPYAALS